MEREKRIFPRGFNFEGHETVSTVPLDEMSFGLHVDLREEDKIAQYDESIIRKYWNSNVIQQSWSSRFKSKWRFGVIRRTCPIILLFVAMYYLFSIVMLSTVCHPASFNVSVRMDYPRMIHFMSQNHEINDNYKYCAEYTKNNAGWVEKERNLTRVLTFLIGFYVGFIVRNYWASLRYFPTFDSLCMGMGSFVFASSEVDENVAGIMIDNVWISIKQLKKDIVRLSLLSWTMCLCRISKPLKSKFMQPEDYNQKKLLTYEEYQQLSTETNDDSWLEKWTTPLLWVNKLVCTVTKDTKVTDETGNLVAGVRFDAPKEIGIAIFKLKDNLQNLSNQYYFKIPDLMLQCISTALYFFMLLGVFAAQGSVFHPNDKRPIAEKLIVDFPLYFCVKYCLLIGWLKAAKDLQNPFGEDM